MAKIQLQNSPTLKQSRDFKGLLGLWGLGIARSQILCLFVSAICTFRLGRDTCPNTMGVVLGSGISKKKALPPTQAGAV